MTIDRTSDLSLDELKELIEGTFNTLADRIRSLGNDLNMSKEYCQKALTDHNQAMIINELKDLGQKINNFSNRLSIIETKLNGEDDD